LPALEIYDDAQRVIGSDCQKDLIQHPAIVTFFFIDSAI
jgi:hypothetical protein